MNKDLEEEAKHIEEFEEWEKQYLETDKDGVIKFAKAGDKVKVIIVKEE